MAVWSAERRERRETPVTDCTRRRDAEAKNEFATSYGVDVYRRAVKRACERAKVRVFSPHELRHSFVTRAAEACGALAASVAVNHTRVSTTEGYLHADRSLAYQVVAKLEAAG
jgi:integrase